MWWSVGDRCTDRMTSGLRRAEAFSGEGELADCRGATLDPGCGPGRLTAALAGRGVPTLGIDAAAAAVAWTIERGGRALRRDIFEPPPGGGSMELDSARRRQHRNRRRRSFPGPRRFTFDKLSRQGPPLLSEGPARARGRQPRTPVLCPFPRRRAPSDDTPESR